MIIFIAAIGKFKKSAIKVNKDALLEYERLKENDFFSMLKRGIIADNTITILVHNVRSFSKHVNDIVSDSRIMNKCHYRTYRNTTQSVRF